MIDVFGNADVLDHVDFSEAHGRVSLARFPRIERDVRTQPDPNVYRIAGDMAGRALDLRIIADVSAGGSARSFRLLDRRMAFARENRRIVRVLNLLPVERAARDRRERATVRLRATLDGKARDAATPLIGRLVNALIQRDRAYMIPRAWFEGGFLPEMLVGRSLAACVEVVVGYHHTGGFDRDRLAAWQDTLIEHARRRRPQTRPPGIASPSAFHFEFPEDVQTLGDLA